MNADELSERANLVARSANHWLEHASEARMAHEKAALSHEAEATSEEREYHLRRAAEHRKAADYWAKREKRGF